MKEFAFFCSIPIIGDKEYRMEKILRFLWVNGEDFTGDTMILSIFYYRYHLLYTRDR
mgnify:CR=1 FL=1